MQVEFENLVYSFRDSLTISEFLTMPYILPIHILELVGILLYGEFKLDWCKDILLRNLIFYENDSKKFIYKDNLYWLDSEVRASILSTLSYYNEDTFTLILGNELIQMKKDKVISFIKELDIHSYNCKLKNQEYINKINSLQNVEDITFEFPKLLNLENYL